MQHPRPFRHLRKALAGLVFAASLGAAPAALARAADETNVFAWQVLPPGATDQTVPDVLVGTMHLPLDAGKHLPAALVQRLDRASRFAMEVDIGSVNPAMVAKYVRIPDGQPDLKAQLSPRRWKELVGLASKHGIDAGTLAHLAPWYISVAFLDLGSPQDALMDSMLRGEATKAHVPVSFLETAEDQFRALATVAPKENVAQLGEVLDDPKRPKRELVDLEKAYRKADLTQIQGLMLGPDRVKMYPDFYRKVFWDRNARWVPKIDGMFANGGGFVAVGLGHMLGDRGLISLLSRQGYQVTPLTL